MKIPYDSLAIILAKIYKYQIDSWFSVNVKHDLKLYLRDKKWNQHINQ